MRRSKTIQLTIVCSVAAALLACDDPQTRYCVDQNQRVVDERDCAYGSAGHWYYGRSGYSRGSWVSGGSTTVPSGGYATQSGTVRGGMGRRVRRRRADTAVKVVAGNDAPPD